MRGTEGAPTANASRSQKQRIGTTKAGPCMAGPPGSIPQHGLCDSKRCTCECHGEKR